MTEPPYTKSEAQLQDLLTKLCNDGKLEYTGTNYVRPAPRTPGQVWWFVAS